jgi:uncharacterized protein YdeI (YjbR/CyaY-like superfamily)
MVVHKGLEVMAFPTQAAFQKWLRRAGAQTDGVWIQFAKKASGVRSITYEEAREVALAHGWIDGLLNPWDDASFLRRFTPRRPRSKWSKINREIAEGLIAAGAMQPAGRAEVEAAKADGRWAAAYDSSSTITVPEDLAAALAVVPAAEVYFGALSRTHRYAVLYRIHDAKRADTRARRIAHYVAAFARGEVGH